MNKKAVVAAMEGVIPLFVDFNDDKQKLCEKYEASARPTLVIADQDGKSIQKFEGAAGVPKLDKVVPEFAQKYFRDFPWAESLEKASGKAKESKLRVGLYFADDTETSRAFVKVLADKTLKEVREHFLFVKIPFKKDSEDARAHKVTKSVTLLVLDPEQEGKELDRVEGKKTSRELKTFLEKYIREAK